MQIIHNGKTYKIGKNSPWDLEDFLASNVMMWYLELVEGMYNCEHNKWTPYAHCDICWPHTIGWWNCKISVEETKPLIENALPLFDRTNENKWYKMKIEETKPTLEESFAEDFPNTWWNFVNWKPAILKPTYWYVERIEMMEKNYWNIFKEWYLENANWKPDFTSRIYWFYNDVWTVWDYWQQKLSPQQWYDTIYDWEKKTEECQHHWNYATYTKDWRLICWKCLKPNRMILEDQLDHDKPMDKWVEEKIEMLPTFEAHKKYPDYNNLLVYTVDTEERQLELLTNAVNKLISFHNK